MPSTFSGATKQRVQILGSSTTPNLVATSLADIPEVAKLGAPTYATLLHAAKYTLRFYGTVFSCRELFA